MIYSISEEVPSSWNSIIETFLTMSEYSIEFHQSPDVYDVNVFVRNGLLFIDYKGGDYRIDCYALFAKEMSSKICIECGDPATRRIFKSPKCDNCY